MKRFSPIATGVVLFAMLVSCSHSPKTLRDSEAIRQIRLDYIRNNPDSPYKDYILKGEVVKGMNFMSVLASWGLPNVRRISEGLVYEHWIYYTQDKAAGVWNIYELIFRDQTLVGWKIDKNIAGQGGLMPVVEEGEISLDKLDATVGSKPIKKK